MSRPAPEAAIDSRDAMIAGLRKRVAELELENQRLVEQLSASRAREGPLHRPPSAKALSREISGGGGGAASAAAPAAGIALPVPVPALTAMESTVAGSLCDNWYVKHRDKLWKEGAGRCTAARELAHAPGAALLNSRCRALLDIACFSRRVRVW